MQYSNFPDLHHYTKLNNWSIIGVLAYCTFAHLFLTKQNSLVEIWHSGVIIILKFWLDSFSMVRSFGDEQLIINFAWPYQNKSQVAPYFGPTNCKNEMQYN